jgi:hypothetical protein
MKPQEELEQLKLEIYKDIKGSIGEYYGFFSAGFNIGYSQCQKDNADKKYTEEDMLKAFMAGVDCESRNGKNFEQFINSLNKQD